MATCNKRASNHATEHRQGFFPIAGSLELRTPHRKSPSLNVVAPWLTAMALLAALAGCTGEPPDPSGHGDGYALYPKLPHVTGHIDLVNPQTENPRYFSLLAITDVDRTQWRFHSEGWVGVSVGHLKDHQIQGITVTVWYETRPDGSLVARFVGD